MGQITIYPDEALEKAITEGAEKQKRSLNNFLIYVLENVFKKEMKEIKEE